ncbi:hypothetical protein [Paenibacillus alba]|uniref:Uncharacterized protein n=1 Tax=Paenibacillus alba TaxID=1197127 RepID=A0ABU6G4L7_9BACL|nr:hypothetical protein [Paenibacillus alba]MEC0227709.1 hypothetical protein [Paenibacillus alba]
MTGLMLLPNNSIKAKKGLSLKEKNIELGLSLPKRPSPEGNSIERALSLPKKQSQRAKRAASPR